MTLLNPLALLWLGSIPVLLWLWRLASTHRQIRIPSLVPFERLVKRQSRHRTRLVVSVLFWMQLVALCGLTLALAQPVIKQPHARVLFMVVDTSASMGARSNGSSAFERARRALLARIARKAPTEECFIMSTSPVTAMTPQPTSDGVALTRAVQELRVSHLGGNLSTTMRIGRALLVAEPDETFIVTDEPPPATPLGQGAQWVTVGTSLPNVAIVGIDAQGPLCRLSDARVIVTVQNFSDAATTIAVNATQRGQRLAEAQATLEPHARQVLSLALPNDTAGLVELTLIAPHDSLEVDNHAWLDVRRSATLPILVRTQSSSLTHTLSNWLSACEALTWTTDATHSGTAHLLISDQERGVSSAAAASLTFLPPTNAHPVLSHWVAALDHPISAYFPTVEAVTASLNLSVEGNLSGAPVISGLVNGRKVPIVVADEREGKRHVFMLLDPAASPESTPLVLAFFNSLHWLIGTNQSASTGESLTLSGLKPGRVVIHRPDGAVETTETHDGLLRYDATTLAGPYRVTQGATDRTIAMNFFDPLESNLTERASTWHSLEETTHSSMSTHPSIHPLSHVVMLVILALLVVEWWRYSLKH